MQRKVTKICRSLIVMGMLAFAAALSGCQGDTGPQGPAGTSTSTSTEAAALAAINLESCGTCHAGAGAEHQAVYTDARTGSTNSSTNLLAGAFTVQSIVDNGDGTYTINATYTFSNGFDPSTTSIDTKSFKWAVFTPDAVNHPATGGTFPDAGSLTVSATTSTGFTLTATTAYNFLDAGVNPTGTVDGDLYAYFAKGKVTGATDTDLGGHVQMYNNVYNAGYKFGTWTYTSPTDVSSCEKCHGTPYLKHGYRGAEATNLDDFVACKNCHADGIDGGDFGTEFLGVSSYKMTLINDVHTTHMNEFPYPQSMSNCVTCHTYTDGATGKYATTLSDANFTYDTCISCHGDDINAPIPTGTLAKGLSEIMPSNHPVSGANLPTADCINCHAAGNGYGAPTFQQIHGGYDIGKYDSAAHATSGTLRYSYVIDTLSYDSTANAVTMTWHIVDENGTTLTTPLNSDVTSGVAFLGLPTDATRAADANGATEGVQIMLGYFGWGSNNVADYDMIHVTSDTTGSTTADAAGEVTTVFPLDATKVSEYGVTKVDLGIIGLPEISYTDPATGTTSNIFAAVQSVTATVTIDGTNTQDVRSQAITVAKCNACHDNIEMHIGGSHAHSVVGDENACVFCHNTSNAAHSYSQQSRSIDGFVHAIHAFPNPETAGVDNPFIFPTFTLQDCEACHTSGSYEVPNQSTRIGSVISAPEGNVTVGPASRACGSCHRALDLKYDNLNTTFGDTASLNAHTKTMGYWVPTADAPYTDVMTQVEALLNGN